MHIMTLAVIAKEHQKDMLEEAQEYRMLKSLRAGRPRFQERLSVRLGDFLISAGLRLKERYQSEMCPELEAYQSGC